MGLRNWWRWRDDRRCFATLGAVCAAGVATAADVADLTGYSDADAAYTLALLVRTREVELCDPMPDGPQRYQVRKVGGSS